MSIIFHEAETAGRLVESVEAHDQSLDLAAPIIEISRTPKISLGCFSLGKKFMDLFLGSIEGA